MATDWKKVASERLTTIRVHERREQLLIENIEQKVREGIRTAVHASCFASLGDERTKQMIDVAVAKIIRDLNLGDKA
jgi:type III secretory pathway component EscV